jgi:hypothetical protein
VALERRLADFLVQEPLRLARALLVLTENRAGFRPEIRLGVFQVLEAIGLDVHDLLQVFGIGDDVVGRLVGPGGRVAEGAHLRRFLVVVRVFLGAPEHHVLEEVGEPAASGLHFVAAAGADDGHVGELAGCASLDQVCAKPVVELHRLA